MIFPCGTNENESLTLAYEFALNPGPGQELGLGGLCILDSRTGQQLHQIEADARVFDGDSYFELLQAQPRIIGTVAWRLSRRQVDQELLFELRAWDFSRSEGEQVIHVWKHDTGQHLRIAFADNKSPYLITQTSYPWQLLLVGMGMEGWSQLTCAVGCTHHNDESAVIGLSLRHDNSPGLVLPLIQTWKLADPSKAPLKPLASWMLPPFRIAWPPAMGPELRWVAFGNTRVDHEWKATHVPSEKVLIFDGHTGEHFKLAFDSPFEQSTVSAAGNLLLIRQDPDKQQCPCLMDVRTGTRLEWPANVPHLETITEVHLVRNSDGLLLVFCDLISSIDGAVVVGVPGNRSGSTMLMKRHGNALSLIAQTPLRTDPKHAMIPTTHAGLELVVQALADSAPPPFCENSVQSGIGSNRWLTNIGQISSQPSRYTIWLPDRSSRRFRMLIRASCINSISLRSYMS